MMEIHSKSYMKFVFTFIFTFLLFLSISLPTTFASPVENEVEDESHFTYKELNGKGPKNWGRLNSTWKACGNGKLQSPIDLLNERVQIFPTLGKLKRGYKPAPAILKNRGHDIAVEWKGDAGKLVINNTDYELKQCHWHSPSEHTLNNTRYKQELHIVHQNSEGGIAVIGILYKLGRPDTFIDQILHHIKAVGAIGEIDLGEIDPKDIKFGSRKYYRYLGSLTVPPCTEGVIWTILKKVRTVSKEQIHALREAVHDGFEENARPTQWKHGRPVYLYRPKAV
ncbi:OLC1v1036689C3 [Oldenlandia corymbosa var. corymbosa]|nr:OLC1v1036689C3 [Oldenlandia corymbosa var. corymbosa]